MPSHSEEPGIWLSVWRFLLTHCLYERAAKVLARLRGCAGSPEPSLLAYAISTKFAWRGPKTSSSLVQTDQQGAAISNSSSSSFLIMKNESPYDKTNKMTCAPSEDSDQPGHPPSLISLLSPSRNIGPLTIYWVHREHCVQTGWMPRLICVFAGCTCHFVGLFHAAAQISIHKNQHLNCIFPCGQE